MEKKFKASDLFSVPDGTKVASLFSSTDALRSVAGSKESLSIAIGEIPPGTKSKIHVHPVVSQVTFVLDGAVSIFMKDRSSSERYKLEIKKDEAVLTQEGTFFQLVNESETTCRVMYVVTPEFLFEAIDGEVLYNDAIVLEEDWEELAQLNWNPPELKSSNDAAAGRRKALERVLLRKSQAR